MKRASHGEGLVLLMGKRFHPDVLRPSKTLATVEELLGLKAAARADGSGLHVATLGAWRVAVSCEQSAEELWNFSAQLIDGSRSTGEDWRLLGEITAMVGAPREPLFPIEHRPPNAVHHWAWFEPRAAKEQAS